MTVTYHADSSEQTDGAKDRCGGTDCTVSGILQPGIEQVAESARRKEQQPGGSGAQVAAEPGDEDAADHQIAEQMLPVGMQGESGDQSPPLSVYDLACVSVTKSVPTNRVVPSQVDVVQGEIVKDADDNQNPDGCRPIVDQRCVLWWRRWPAMILLLILT